MSFQSLLQEKPCGDVDSRALYQWIRAHAILAHYEPAKRLLSELEPARLSSAHRALCEAQLDAFQFRNIDTHIASILAMESDTHGSIKGDFYALAELQFTLGFLYSMQSKFRMALGYYERAADLYARAGYERHEGATHFNLFVCANHLGFSSKAEFHRGRLEALERQTGEPALRAMLRRQAGYRALDREDFAAAQTSFEEAHTLFWDLGRTRDADSTLSHIAYVLLKQDRLNEFDSLVARQAGAGVVASNRFRAYQWISQQSFVGYDECRLFVTELENQGIDGISLILIGDLLLAALLRSKEYVGVLRIYEQIRHWRKRYEQATDLVDFRYYPIYTYCAMGNLDAARHLLTQYEIDARSRDSAERLRKSRELWKMIDDSPREGVSADDQVVVDLEKEVVVRGKVRVSLAKMSTIKRFLGFVFEAKGPADYFAAFEHCYETSFDPILHEARYHSLIARVRKILGDSDAIIWSDRNFRPNPRFCFTYVPSPKLGQANKVRRQEKLVPLIEKRFPDGVTLTTLRPIYAVSMRTLQLDLRDLLRKRLISKHGKGKNTFYTSIHYAAPKGRVS